jgi:hypothetical protein
VFRDVAYDGDTYDVSGRIHDNTNRWTVHRLEIRVKESKCVFNNNMLKVRKVKNIPSITN